MVPATPLTITISTAQSVSALLLEPPEARAMYVFGHGAGVGMNHTFMETVAGELYRRGVGTLRYQFPYMERGDKRLDPPRVAHATVRAVVSEAARLAPTLPLFAGGKSYGGRMTSEAQAHAPLPYVRGLIFLGFPLHPSREPAATRGEHLDQVQVPMLFVQGTRDELADMTLLKPLIAELGPRATLNTIEDGDHSFKVHVSLGFTQAGAMKDVCDSVARWIDAVLAG